MFGAILKATNSSFQKGITFCRIIYVKKVMKLLAFIFEQPSYAGHLRSVREYILQSFDEVHVEQWKINKICTFRTYQSKQDGRHSQMLTLVMWPEITVSPRRFS